MTGYVITNNLGEEINRALKNLDHYDAVTRSGIKREISDGTKATYEAAISRAHLGPTGNLRSGIRYEMTNSGNSGTVKSTAPHGHLVEFGSSQRIVLPRTGKALLLKNGDFVRGAIPAGAMPATPFMRPAVEQERPKIQEAIREVLRRGTG